MVGPILGSLLSHRPDLSTNEAPLAEIFDQGSNYLVKLSGRTRTFTDEARHCSDRARQVALFIALALPDLQPSDELIYSRVRGRRMWKAGVGLLVVGLVHLTIGAAILGAVFAQPSGCQPPSCRSEFVGLLIPPAAASMSLGGLLSLAGTPLIAAGIHLERSTLQLSLAPLDSHGALVSVGFRF